jgi:hypothetical protein
MRHDVTKGAHMIVKIGTVLIGIVFLFALSGNLRAGDISAVKHGAMHLSKEQFLRWVENFEKAPKARIDRDISARLSEARTKGKSTSMDLLQYLQYTPAERAQGECGNCWVWAGTALYEIYLSVEKKIKDRLSIQYLNSCREECACCGGDLTTFLNWYNTKGKVIPWANDNASYADGARVCTVACTPAGVSCDNIAVDKSHPIDSFQAESIETHGVGQDKAIENIKNIVNQKKAIVFSYALANKQDWNSFDAFWRKGDEAALWNQDKHCGKDFDPNGGMAHSTVLVGYNDDDPDPKKHYWVILNSEGTADGNRPNNLFRVPMRMNYDCKLKQGGTSDNVVHFEILGAKSGKSITLTFKGTGEGRVTSNPSGIDCSTSNKTCSANFADGESVLLTPIANQKNSTFAGWSGGECEGTGPCEVTLDDDVELEDTFDSVCTYVIAPSSKKIPAKGGSFAVRIRSDEGEDCPSPQATATAPWIGTKDPVFSNDRGSATVIVAPNDGPAARSGQASVGGQSFTVNQAGVICRLAALKPASAKLPVDGGKGQFTVSAQGGCEWTADVDAKDRGWITIDSGTTGKGAGTVAYSVVPNKTGKILTGRINLVIKGSPDKKKVFTVTQRKN